MNGASIHTPYKHGLLNDIVAVNLGAASRIEWLSEAVLIDACSGDGVSNGWSGTSSPEIIYYHAGLAKSKPTRVVLIDRDPIAIQQHRQKFGNLPNVTIIEGNYQSEYTAKMIGPINYKANVLLHIDPNHVNDVDLSAWLRWILPDSTLVLVTMGCNAHGIKRLPLEGDPHVRKSKSTGKEPNGDFAQPASGPRKATSGATKLSEAGVKHLGADCPISFRRFPAN